MRRPIRITLAALLLVAAVLSLAMAVAQATLTYHLHPTAPGHLASQHTAFFVPTVIASVVAGITVLTTAGWVILVSVRARPRALWFGVLGLVVVDLVVLMVTTGLSRPIF